MIAALRAEGAAENVDLVHADFLEFDLAGWRRPGRCGSPATCPTTSSSPILFRLHRRASPEGSVASSTRRSWCSSRSPSGSRRVPAAATTASCRSSCSATRDVRRLLTLPPGAFRPMPDGAVGGAAVSRFRAPAVSCRDEARLRGDGAVDVHRSGGRRWRTRCRSFADDAGATGGATAAATWRGRDRPAAAAGDAQRAELAALSRVFAADVAQLRAVL